MVAFRVEGEVGEGRESFDFVTSGLGDAGAHFARD
jgi:hypothetical protein